MNETIIEDAPKKNKIIINLSPSSLDELQSCFRKFNFGAIRQYTTTKKKSEMERGIVMHRMLEEWYKYKMMTTRPPFAVAVDDCIMIGRQACASTELDGADISQTMSIFREYCLFYQNEPWTAVAVESAFSRKVYDDGEFALLFEGKLDLVVDGSNARFIVDHKTSSQMQPLNSLTNQFLGYAAILNTPNIIVNRISYAKTGPAVNRFQRITISFTQEQIQEWLDELQYWIVELKNSIFSGYFPANYSSCRYCQFKDVCMAPISIRDWKLKNEFVTRPKHDLFERV